MEAFEAFVALAMEAEGLVVSEAVKFPVRMPTRRKDHLEVQRHGYEVDLIGARSDRLVLSTVKSYLGSRGVVAEHVTGDTGNEQAARRFSLLNRREVRGPVVRGAAKRYGYSTRQVELRLYVGKFARRDGTNEARVRAWARSQRVGAGRIRVFNLSEVIAAVRPTVVPTEYRDNPVIVTWKVLEAAGMITSPNGEPGEVP